MSATTRALPSTAILLIGPCRLLLIVPHIRASSATRCSTPWAETWRRAAFIASGPTAPTPERADVVSLRPAVGRDRPHLDRVAALYVSGAVRGLEVKVYDLAQAGEALRVSEGRHFRGKLVLKVR
jgi:hypothetical protein